MNYDKEIELNRIYSIEFPLVEQCFLFYILEKESNIELTDFIGGNWNKQQVLRFLLEFTSEVSLGKVIEYVEINGEKYINKNIVLKRKFSDWVNILGILDKNIVNESLSDVRLLNAVGLYKDECEIICARIYVKIYNLLETILNEGKKTKKNYRLDNEIKTIKIISCKDNIILDEYYDVGNDKRLMDIIKLNIEIMDDVNELFRKYKEYISWINYEKV